jgi:Uma2 family endonuclease
MNAHVPLPAPDVPTRYRFTVDDVQALVDSGVISRDASTELLDGEIIVMPSEGAPHLNWKEALNRALVTALGPEWRVFPDASLHLSAEDAPEPDFYVLPRGAEVKPVDPAAIALAVEIADTSLGHDLGRKSAKYAEYGVAEYWVVDLNSRRTHVLRKPEGGAYHDITAVPFDGELAATRLPLRLVLTEIAPEL